MKILVIGGYGNFGKRLVESLLAYGDHQIIVAGRSIEKARLFQQAALVQFNRKVDIDCFDILITDLPALFKKWSPELVINAAGPYQLQAGIDNYRVAKACLTSQSHYIDLADDQDFVMGFAKAFDKQARDQGLIMVTGASTVPALTDAVMQYYGHQFSKLDSVDFGISPGNRTERGAATVASILSYTGKTFDSLINGKRQALFGWQNLRRYDFGYPIGKRWMSNCKIADLELLPTYYADLKTVRFQAGLDLTVLHLGLWVLSWLVRAGLVKTLSRFQKWLIQISYWFFNCGSDKGGMFVNLQGTDKNQKAKTIQWQLIAEDGSGPQIPAISAELLVQKIAKKQIDAGARPCLRLFSLVEFLTIAGRWGIYQKEGDHA